MKKLLLAALLLSGLASCNNGSDDPTPTPAGPALTGNAWVWTSSTTAATPKAGGVVTNQSKTVIPNTVKATYGTDGSYTVVIDKSISPVGVTSTTTGTYTYSGGTINSGGTITYNTSGKTSTARVDVLTNTNLTTVTTSEDTSTRYVTTDTFTR